MYPHERSLVARMKGKPFALIGVNSDRDINTVKKACQTDNLTWRSFWNGPKGTGGPISAFYGVRGWPTIYLIDHNGVIRYKNKRGPELDKALDLLVSQVDSVPQVQFPVEGMGPVVRTWTAAAGEHTFEATFEKFEKGTVHLKGKDGREVTLKMTELSKDDQAHIRDHLRKEAAIRRKKK